VTLSDFATFSTAISGFAVTASLVYLALQTHQNAKHTKALIQQGRAARVSSVLIGFSDSERVAAILVAAGSTPTPEAIKIHQARLFYNLTLLGWTDVFEQHELGLLSEDQFADLQSNVLRNFRVTAFQAFWEDWKANRPSSHSKFKTWVDGAVLRIATSTKPT
jgi:hypothetical protein